jgi:hypothetical protein
MSASQRLPSRFGVPPGLELAHRDAVPLLHRILHARGLTSPDAIAGFCDPKLAQLRFNLKRLPPGAASGVKFIRRGVAEVRCAIHRDMRMKVIV